VAQLNQSASIGTNAFSPMGRPKTKKQLSIRFPVAIAAEDRLTKSALLPFPAADFDDVR
jgi:hypothetical protein